MSREAAIQDSISPEIVILSNLPDSLQPKTFHLDTMPKPLIVEVPKRNGGYYNFTNDNGEVERIKLMPPVQTMLPVLKNGKGENILDAEGKPYFADVGDKADFTNFNVDNGLASDEIFCLILDKAGNIWFGTNGGGVSRYDGKSFTNFTTLQGLSHNMVSCIYEDKAGNLWFGTYGGGASCYNGKSFYTFTTSQGLASDIVNSITEDKDGDIWFGTWAGVSCYNGKRINHPCSNNSCKHNLLNLQDLKIHNGELAKCFTTYTTAQGLINNIVVEMFEDKSGNLWFGTNEDGVSCYDGKSFTNFTTAQGLTSNSISSIQEDSTGNIWIGTYDHGISIYSANWVNHPCNLKTCKHNLKLSKDLEEHNKEIARSFTSLTTENGLISNSIQGILVDKKRNIWVGTLNGVIRYDGKSFYNFTTAQGLASNIISCILEDKSGNIWFGTHTDGVSRYNGETFTSVTKMHWLENNLVHGIIEDKSGNLWFGFGESDGLQEDGVTLFNGESFITFNEAQGLRGNGMYSFLEDKTGSLWIGSFGGGLSRYDGTSFTNFTTAQGLASNSIYCMLEDKSGYIWIGTFGGGISRYDGKSFTNFTTAQGLASNVVYSIAEDISGHIWFGTSSGACYYDENAFTTYTSTEGPLGNRVLSMVNDKDGNLWFATSDDGVSRVLRKDIEALRAHTMASVGKNENPTQGDGKKSDESKFLRTPLFEKFSMPNGLATNRIFTIDTDSKGNIFLGTNLGFAVIPASESMKPFSELKSSIEYFTSSTFPVKQISFNAMLCDSKGIVWAGTESQKTRLVRFDYAARHTSEKPPLIVIKNVDINDEPVCWYDLLPSLDDSTTLVQQERIIYGRTLTVKERTSVKKKYRGIQFDSITSFYPIPKNLILPFNQNNISIDFQAIETGRNAKIRYQYVLEGYSKEWSPETEKTSAIFGNMAPGKYTFKFKAKSPDGVWSDPMNFSFMVLPPWYRTWWMYALYFFTAAGSIWYYIKYRERSLRENQIKLEKTIVDRTAEVVQQRDRAEQSEKFKQQFLANMSHEIRTPMNAVMGMTNLVLHTKLEEKQKFYLERIQKSSDNLLHIINDILDLSKIEAGKMELEQIDFSIRDVVEQVKQTLNHKAEEKGLHLISEIQRNIPEVVIGDPVRLNQVLMNLTGNAIKFTEKGSVSIVITQAKHPESIHFSIVDTGIGIPKDKLQTVFESFSQANASDTRKFGGTGLGLTISRQLVQLMDGHISIESEEAVGTTFSFEIRCPVGSPERLRASRLSEEIDGITLDGLKILLVDDNEYNLTVANDTIKLKSDVDIMVATNGKEAIELLREFDFDVILMDVQMPLMNGYEATRYIREQFSSPKNSIPVIALTASVVRTDLDKCRAAGMNDYVPKPFKPFQLVSAIAKATGREIKFGEKNLVAAMEDNRNNSRVTNLSYLEKFCEGDRERMQKYISMFITSAPALIEKLNEALAAQDIEEIANQVHAYKTKWIMMGMTEVKDLAQMIEVKCRNGTIDYELRDNVSTLIQIIYSGIKELKSEK